MSQSGPELLLPDKTKEELEALKAQVLALMPEENPLRGLELRVSPKGALALWGLRTMPVTLYRNEWEQILGMSEIIRGFIRANPELIEKKFIVAPRAVKPRKAQNTFSKFSGGILVDENPYGDDAGDSESDNEDDDY